MNYEKYEFVLESPDLREFRFYSVGPNGRIPMVILFQQMYGDLYNLAFGEYDQGESINDHGQIRNLDRNKILATVASAIFEFLNRYPDRLICFSGSSDSRCRLYRMAISINLIQLSKELQIFGCVRTNDQSIIEPFVKSGMYHEFLIRKK